MSTGEGCGLASASGRSLSLGDTFPRRHIGPSEAEVAAMLEAVGCDSLGALVDQVVPADIRSDRPLDLPAALTESEALAALRALADQNRVARSFIGLGYHDTLTPPVILRNVLENPAWYTQYTPYQAEIAQGRLEALLNFQTMVADLTGLPVANASLLDEATAAAEAMTLCLRARSRKSKAEAFFASERCHPQTLEVLRTRAEPLGIELIIGDAASFDFSTPVFGVLLQYPDTEGTVESFEDFAARAHEHEALVCVATDLLALTTLRAPGALGADVAFGNSQRFGVPLGFGGPHAAFMSCTEDHKRRLPGRIVGVSRDSEGHDALRLALQTREQHIKRDRATSNICTAQVLLAVVASFYAVYHGPEGLRAMAARIRRLALTLRALLAEAGFEVGDGAIFDTLTVRGGPRPAADILAAAAADGINLRRDIDGAVGVALDEATTVAELVRLASAFGVETDADTVSARAEQVELGLDPSLARRTPFMEHPVFRSYHSETELLRYIHRLAGRDLSLTHSMIPLGSCTMKLNGTAEMIPVTWPEFGGLHPFAPLDQAEGYRELFRTLEQRLAEITGFAAVSLQPNAGSQGEYAGLLAIRGYHHSRGDTGRQICLIPQSAHGTNPASAVMAGMKVVVVKCDENGNIDVADLEAKASKHADKLAALMVTYPSTHGVFEEGIRELCAIIHRHGGQVYLDGANMNALVGVCRPAEFGADVCHLNLHKTFCIPHGGGGPGMGPIGVAEHLAPFVPGHSLVPELGGESALSAVSAAPWGSPSILPISWAYIALMGPDGLTRATEVAILNANYMAKRLDPHFPVLYRGARGRVAHECIIDLRALQQSTGVTVEDVAKRLIDFGFHAPTMSWPVGGTLMIEPTESESQAEMDRFCDALIAIRAEIREIEEGRTTRDDSPLRYAPHTAAQVTADEWTRPYSRSVAAWPAPWLKDMKFWPAVSRIDNVFGDRNLVCSCPPLEDYEG